LRAERLLLLLLAFIMEHGIAEGLVDIIMGQITRLP